LLDPDIQRELKKSANTVAILHMAMLFEPIAYLIVAFVLKSAGFGGTMHESQDIIPLMHSVFMLISVAVIPAVILLRRILFTPERIVPSGTNVQRIATSWARAQLVVDALAVILATLGLVLFLMNGNMNTLAVLTVGSLVILALVFPRYGMVEEAVTARILQGETIEPVSEEATGR
jgi:hypothetical protein